MATPTNAQLGKLLATYFSTSNDALAITFRKHYLPTTSPTPPRKPKAKRTTPRVTTATFTYRHSRQQQEQKLNYYLSLK